MYSFPDTLHSEVQPMFYDDSIAFGFPAGNTIFYSRMDGKWGDVGTWETVNGSVRLPGAGDVVYVRHAVTANVSATVLYLFNTGTINFLGSFNTLTVIKDLKSTGNIYQTLSNGVTLTVNGNSYISGTLDVTGMSNVYFKGDKALISGLTGIGNVYLYGSVNTITNSDTSTTSIYYVSNGIQQILPITYLNTGTQSFGIGQKIIAEGVVILGKLVQSFNIANLLIKDFTLSVPVSVTSTNNINLVNATLITPSIIGVGGGNNFILDGSSLIQTSNISLSSSWASILGGTILIVDNGTFSGDGVFEQITSAITISSGKTTTITGTGIRLFNINGQDNSSTLVSKSSNVYFQGATQPMANGVLDCSTNVNTWRYNLAGAQEVKGTTYSTLELGGSGVKKLMGNVTVLNSYSLTGTATVDLNGFTLTTP